jgi:hypothetical protein
MQAGARVGLARADHRRNLGIGQAGEELEADELALAGVEARHRLAQRGPAQRQLGRLLGGGGTEVLGIGRELGDPPPPAQLVERGVAGDPEDPSPAAAAACVEAAALAVGTLERLGGDVTAAERSRSSPAA